ncbi:unnamed protein product, partial [Musa textilis]
AGRTRENPIAWKPLFSVQFDIINLLSRIHIAFNLRKQRQLNLVNLTSKHADSFNKTAASAYP